MNTQTSPKWIVAAELKADAKRALGSGQVDKQEYKDNIWVLKEIRTQAIYKAEAKYRAGTFTRPEFGARRHQIDVEYVGP